MIRVAVVLLSLMVLCACQSEEERRRTEMRERLDSLEARLAEKRAQLDARIVSAAEYRAIKLGMSLADVEKIVGTPGELVTESRTAGFHTFAVSWKNPDGSNALAMFQNGALVTLSQSGL